MLGCLTSAPGITGGVDRRPVAHFLVGEPIMGVPSRVVESHLVLE